jgi:hypothetical protein
VSDRIVSLGIGLTAMLATAVGMKIATTPPAPTDEVAVVIAEPQARASVPVVIPVPQPQLLVVHATPPALPTPPPPAIEYPAPLPEPRAAAPYLDVACDLEASMSEGGEAGCFFDRGFPAISADGTTIVQAVYPGDGGRGFPALEVRFLDAATSRVIATHAIIDPEDFDDYSAPKQGRRAAMDRRAARVTAKIAAGRYRSLAKVQGPDGELVKDTGLRADVDGERIRLVDTTANTSLWEHHYDVAVQFPNRKLDPDVDSCEPGHVSSMSAWWDAPTRTLLTQVSYGAGPCYCDNVDVNYVVKL